MSNNEKRKDYISWDEYFMAIAKLSAMRSKEAQKYMLIYFLVMSVQK